MRKDILALNEEARALNKSVFSLLRLQLLSSLADLGQESVTYRELKAALQVTDGALYSNINVLIEMGYVKSAKVTLEGKELESYQLTDEGRAEWERVKAWLTMFLNCGGEEK